jgi:protein O-GlcNAc transferase
MSSINPTQEQINSVVELFTKGQMLEAIDKLEVLANDFPEDALLFNIRGACYAGLGQKDAAVESYKKAALLKPDYAKAHYNLGGALQEICQLDDAVKSYERAIALEPENAEAHNNLGNVLRELEKLDAAINSYEQAIEINPNYVEAHYSLGLTFHDLGQLENTVNSYKQVVAIKPDFAGMHNNLGNVYIEQGELNDALKSYKKAIAIKPDFIEALYSLGMIYQEQNLLNDAIKSYERVISIKPNLAEAHYCLGDIFLGLDRLNDAVRSYESALSIKPKLTEAHNNLGIAFKELGNFDNAVRCYQMALNINPNYAEALLNLGFIHHKRGKLEESIKCYLQALSIQPDYAEVHNNLGNLLVDLGQLDEAVKNFKIAISIKPNYAQAHNNYGIALNALGHQNAADKSYKKAISIKPNYAAAYANHAELLTDLKQFNEALSSFKFAIKLNRNINFALGNFLNTKMHLCIWDNLSINLKEIQEKIINKEKAIDPFSLLALIDDPELQKITADTYVSELYPKIQFIYKLKTNPKYKKIRIGYFSADFREHPVSALTAELYESHNRNKFEIYAFSFGPDTNDEMNLRIKAGVDHFYDVHTMSHKDVVNLSRSMKIDIAINLGGHTKYSRTGIFAMQAAPIQVNYLGYPGTMGGDYMDYLIADHELIPKDKQYCYSEKIVYLPNSYMVNDTKNKVSKRVFSREECGLPRDGFIFCCFNNHYKITPNIFIRWMRILAKVDGSILWLNEGNEIANKNLKIQAEKNNIDESRIIFAQRLNLREEHLNRIQLADLFLDTTPYNAHATTSDALQMGLPVLTFKGNSFVSRVASSLINSVNLPELITTTLEQYESLAIQLAKNPKELNSIKEKLLNNLPHSPLYDTSLYVEHLESAYLKMYERLKKDLNPDHIYVEQ